MTLQGIIKSYTLLLIVGIILAIFNSGCSSNYTNVNPAQICTPHQLENGVQFICEDGTKYVINDGKDGKDGIDGVDGKDGENGKDGIDGQDGADSFIIASINPCGQETEQDEILLITRDGQFLSYFASNGNARNARLVTLQEDKEYMTTDGTGCRFKITNGQLEEL